MGSNPSLLPPFSSCPQGRISLSNPLSRFLLLSLPACFVVAFKKFELGPGNPSSLPECIKRGGEYFFLYSIVKQFVPQFVTPFSPLSENSPPMGKKYTTEFSFINRERRENVDAKRGARKVAGKKVK